MKKVLERMGDQIEQVIGGFRGVHRRAAELQTLLSGAGAAEKAVELSVCPGTGGEKESVYFYVENAVRRQVPRFGALQRNSSNNGATP